MATGTATTVEQYLADLPEERRAAVSAVREAILAKLPGGYEEAMQYGMISYIVPDTRYPDTYNGQPLALASLGNQKNYMAVYLNNIYSDPSAKDWFVEEYRKSGKRLDMGKSCVRFRKLEDLPLDLVGEAIARTPVHQLIAAYEAARSGRPKR